MNRVLCSTGACIGRPNGRDFRLLEQCVERLDCDGFEFMMYESWYGQVEEIISFLNNLNTKFPTFHVEKSVGNLISRNNDGDAAQSLEYFKINCDMAKRIGSELLVLHLWGGIDSDKNISFNIEKYVDLKKISDEYGLELTIENVVCNTKDPFTHLKALNTAYGDVSFTFDTKMAEFHKQLDLIYAPENGEIFKKIKHIHVNDYNGGFMDWGNLKTLHVGEGSVDFERFFGFLRANSYSGDFTVEATSFGQDGIIDFDSLNRTFSKIRAFVSK